MFFCFFSKPFLIDLVDKVFQLAPKLVEIVLNDDREWSLQMSLSDYFHEVCVFYEKPNSGSG